MPGHETHTHANFDELPPASSGKWDKLPAGVEAPAQSTLTGMGLLPGISDLMRQLQAVKANQQTLQLQQSAQLLQAKKQRELYIGNLTVGLVPPQLLLELFNSSISAMFGVPRVYALNVQLKRQLAPRRA